MSPLALHPASVTLAWDASQGSGAAEYIVHYGTSPMVYTAHESAGTSLIKTISGLPGGFRYYFSVTAKNQEGESENSNQVNYRQPSTNPPIQILLQAETAMLELPMMAKANNEAMNGQYVSSTNTDAGTAEFEFTVPFVDEFMIWARTMSQSDGQDSFYVSHNNQPEDVYDTVRIWKNTWQWSAVNGRGGADKPFDKAWAIDPRVFVMFGTNHITFRARETWTGLDAILVTNDDNLVPRPPSIPSLLQLTVGR